MWVFLPQRGHIGVLIHDIDRVQSWQIGMLKQDIEKSWGRADKGWMKLMTKMKDIDGVCKTGPTVVAYKQEAAPLQKQE